MRYVKESKYDIMLAIGVLMFLLFIYFFVPLTHEIGHVIVLLMLKCHYWANFEYGFFNTFYGIVYEKCNLSSSETALLYISGVLLTFVTGIILLIIEYILYKKHKIEWSIITLFISYAYLLDLTNYLFFPEGDVTEFFKTLGIKSHINYLPLLGIVIVILLLTYLFINLNKEIHVIIEKRK